MRPVRTGVLAWLLWRLFGPETPPGFDGPQRHPLRVPGRTVFVGDHELFLREEGDPGAPPVVLVHGWGDHSSMLWHRIMPELAERYRVIAVDNRNNGKSDRIRRPYEVGEIADDVAGVMDAVGIGSAVVVGYSMGGMIVQELAHRHPHRVEKMVLGATASSVPGGRGWLRVPTVAVGMLLRAVERISRAEFSWLRFRYLRRVRAVAPEYERYLWSEHMNRDPSLYWLIGAAVLGFDSRDWVGRLRTPSLVIVTAADQLVPAAAQYDLVARLNSPEVLELAGARHEAPLTHPHEFVAAIDAFAAGGTGRRGAAGR